MKKQLLLLICLILFSFGVRAQLKENFSKKEIFLLSCDKKLPSLNIDWTLNHDSTFSRINEVYDTSGCELKHPIDFKKRLSNQKVWVKAHFYILPSYDSCSTTISNCWNISNICSIKLNKVNKILAAQKVISVDNLLHVLSELDQNEFIDEFRIEWKEGCSAESLEYIFETVCFEYLRRVEILESKKIDSMSKRQLKLLKVKYPFNLTIGNYMWMGVKEIEIIEDIEEIKSQKMNR